MADKVWVLTREVTAFVVQSRDPGNGEEIVAEGVVWSDGKVLVRNIADGEMVEFDTWGHLKDSLATEANVSYAPPVRYTKMVPR